MKLIFRVFLYIFVVPILVSGVWSYAKGWPPSWHEADWSSTGIAPPVAQTPEAVIQVYAARAGRWKGIVAVHTWIIMKPAGAAHYDRYEVVGWGSPVRRRSDNPDGYWYGNAPEIIRDIRGREAADLIPRITAAIDRYPHRDHGTYQVWPGPNSNTFIAWIGRAVPDLQLEMPPTAIGKDFLGDGPQFGLTPSGTGYQASIHGIFGLAVAVKEGLEVHLFGTTFGIDPNNLAIKIPGIGRLGLM